MSKTPRTDAARLDEHDPAMAIASECAKMELELAEAMAETPQRRIIDAIIAELNRAYTKHGRDQWGRHEFYAILKEEVDEAWDAIKADLPQEDLEKEVIQIAAMCVRYLDTKDRYRNPNQCPKDLRVREFPVALGGAR